MNKHYSELKVWSVEMPNAPYSNPSNNKNELKNEYKLYEFVWRHKRDACSGIEMKMNSYLIYKQALFCHFCHGIFETFSTKSRTFNTSIRHIINSKTRNIIDHDSAHF